MGAQATRPPARRGASRNCVCRPVAVMVVVARGPAGGCPSRHEPPRSQGFQIPADNFPNELARVCDSVGKSPACGLDAVFPSHFVMVARRRANNRARVRRALLPRLFGTNPRSHHKGAAGRVRTEDQRSMPLPIYRASGVKLFLCDHGKGRRGICECPLVMAARPMAGRPSRTGSTTIHCIITS